MAPHALAAQLTAQTGQIAGQGVASLLGGIASGVGAFTQKREARRVEAINESRYQDSLLERQTDNERQDRSLEASLLMNQLEVRTRLATGLKVKLQASVDPETGKFDESIAQQIRDIENGNLNLSTNLTRIASKVKEDCKPGGYG
jgi:hypothetical protein